MWSNHCFRSIANCFRSASNCVSFECSVRCASDKRCSTPAHFASASCCSDTSAAFCSRTQFCELSSDRARSCSYAARSLDTRFDSASHLAANSFRRVSISVWNSDCLRLRSLSSAAFNRSCSISSLTRRSRYSVCCLSSAVWRAASVDC